VLCPRGLPHHLPEQHGLIGRHRLEPFVRGWKAEARRALHVQLLGDAPIGLFTKVVLVSWVLPPCLERALEADDLLPPFPERSVFRRRRLLGRTRLLPLNDWRGGEVRGVAAVTGPLLVGVRPTLRQQPSSLG